MPNKMNATAMKRYLAEVGAILASRRLHGKIVMAGSGVVAATLSSSRMSRDIDARFDNNGEAIRLAVAEVARKHGLAPNWLNDQVKVFVAPNAPTEPLWDFPGLTVRRVSFEYLFYMKAWAGDPSDFEDMKLISRKLGLKDEEQALHIIERFSPSGGLPGNIQLMVEGLFQ